MTVNGVSNDTGVLSGKTENVGSSEHWMRINHVMASFRENLDALTRKKPTAKHVNLGIKRILEGKKDEQKMTLA